ncbi:putative mitochondrial protein, partial [Mucuna pruriens]
MNPNLKVSAQEGCYTLSFLGQKICFTVNIMANPKVPHINAVHHLLSYLKGTPDQDRSFSSSSTLHLKAYADADWRNCPDTHRFTMGSCFFLDPQPGQSTELLPVLLVKSFGNVDNTLVFCDNQADFGLKSFISLKVKAYRDLLTKPLSASLFKTLIQDESHTYLLPILKGSFGVT